MLPCSRHGILPAARLAGALWIILTVLAGAYQIGKWLMGY
jgi:hypothetical protein